MSENDSSLNFPENNRDADQVSDSEEISQENIEIAVQNAFQQRTALTENFTLRSTSTLSNDRFQNWSLTDPNPFSGKF